MSVQQMIDAHNEWAVKNHHYRFKTGKQSDHFDHQPVPTVKPKYACPVCEELYDTHAEAVACGVQPFNEAGVRVGDIFIIPNSNKYQGPAPGYEHWCAFTIEGDPTESSHFDHTKQWFPYFVVTAIHRDDRNPHRAICTVVSLFGGDINAGWNPTDSDGHHSMFKPGLDDADQPTDVGSTWWESERFGKTMGERFASAQPCATLLAEAKQLADTRLSTRSLLSQ